MSKRKKVTYGELMDRNLLLLKKTIDMERAIDYLHMVILSYIECNGDEEKLKKYLKEKDDEQSNKSDSDGDREDKSGDTIADTKSPEAGGEPEAGANKNQAQKYC